MQEFVIGGLHPSRRDAGRGLPLAHGLLPAGRKNWLMPDVSAPEFGYAISLRDLSKRLEISRTVETPLFVEIPPARVAAW